MNSDHDNVPPPEPVALKPNRRDRRKEASTKGKRARSENLEVALRTLAEKNAELESTIAKLYDDRQVLVVAVVHALDTHGETMIEITEDRARELGRSKRLDLRFVERTADEPERVIVRVLPRDPDPIDVRPEAISLALHELGLHVSAEDVAMWEDHERAVAAEWAYQGGAGDAPPRVAALPTIVQIDAPATERDPWRIHLRTPEGVHYCEEKYPPRELATIIAPGDPTEPPPALLGADGRPVRIVNPSGHDPQR